MYAALLAGCASLPIFAGMTLCAQLPLPWSSSVVSRLLTRASAFAFLGIFARTVTPLTQHTVSREGVTFFFFFFINL